MVYLLTIRCNRFEVVQKVESESAKLVTEVKIKPMVITLLWSFLKLYINMTAVFLSLETYPGPFHSKTRLYGLSKGNTGSHFITEVKPFWVGLISRWATILVFLCYMPWEVRLALYSTFASPTSAIVHGLSFSQSQPDLKVFIWVFQFSSFTKINSQKISDLGAVLWDHGWPFGGSLRRLSYAFGQCHLNRVLSNSALGAASKSD